MTTAPLFSTLGQFVAQTGLFSGDIAVGLERVEGSGAKPQVTFIVPIYNQAGILAANLRSLAGCSTLPAEYVLVLDACTDDSARIARAWARQAVTTSTRITSIILATCAEEIFETNCDNLGAALATANSLIEVQSDMLMEQIGFDAELVAALQSRADLIAVSARGVHPYSDAIGQTGGRTSRYASKMQSTVWARAASRALERGAYLPSPLIFRLTGRAGRLGELIDLPLERGGGAGMLFIGETVMRGPMAIATDKFRELGGFDGDRFFLGNDDHDLMARALTMRQWRCGFLPVAFASPLSNGATRKEKTPQQKSRFASLMEHYAAQFETSTLATLHRTSVRPRAEVLRLPSLPRDLDPCNGSLA